MNYFKKGNELYTTKDYEKAIEMYNKCLEIHENEPACLYNSAVCFIKLKKYDKAIPLLEAAILKKRQSSYFFNLAYCYSMLNNNKKALIYFNIAWALDNSDKDCEKAISLILNNYKKEL